MRVANKSNFVIFSERCVARYTFIASSKRTGSPEGLSEGEGFALQTHKGFTLDPYSPLTPQGELLSPRSKQEGQGAVPLSH